MGKKIEFETQVQSRGGEGRMVVEIPKEKREDLKVGKYVKVVIRELR